MHTKDHAAHEFLKEFKFQLITALMNYLYIILLGAGMPK